MQFSVHDFGSNSIILHFPAIAKVQRQPAIRSQRPPVSEEHKNYALQKAKQYKSKYPITLQIMKETFVYKTFFMVMLLSPIFTSISSKFKTVRFFCMHVHDSLVHVSNRISSLFFAKTQKPCVSMH